MLRCRMLVVERLYAGSVVGSILSLATMVDFYDFNLIDAAKCNPELGGLLIVIGILGCLGLRVEYQRRLEVFQPQGKIR